MAVKQKAPAEKIDGNLVVREFMASGKMVSFEGHLHKNGGGFVANTAHAADTSFVDKDAAVLENARVLDRASLYGRVRAMGNSVMRDSAVASGEVTLLDNAQIFEEARVYGSGKFMGDTQVYGKADLGGSITYSGKTRIHDGIKALPSASGSIKDAEFSGEYVIEGSVFARNGKYSWHEIAVDGKKERHFGRNHGNGGGFVGIWALVDESVYVGPNAAVIRGHVVGKTRVEDRAVVHNGSINGSGNGVVIKDDAQVYGGNVREEARVENRAHMVKGTLAGKAVLCGEGVLYFDEFEVTVGSISKGRVTDKCSFGKHHDPYGRGC